MDNNRLVSLSSIPASQLDTFNHVTTPMWIYDVEAFQISWANEQALALWNDSHDNPLLERDLSEDMSQVIEHSIKQLAKESRTKPRKSWWTLYPQNIAKQVYIRFSNISNNDTDNLLLCEALIDRDEVERDTHFALDNTIQSLFDANGQLLSGNMRFGQTYDTQSISLQELIEMEIDELKQKMGSSHHVEFERQTINRGVMAWYNFHIKELMPEKHYIVGQENISERKLKEQTYRHLAYHDQLTGLLNRYGFNDYLIEQCHKEQPFYLFLVDLDAFKLVNNNLGHSAGDEVLIEIARRFVMHLPDNYQTCRFGGDEFIVVVPKQQDSQSVDAISQMILDIVSEPIEKIDSIQITASIGAANYPLDAKEPTDLIMYADTAMHKAKERGSKSYCSFAQQMSLEIQRRSAIQQGLKQALNFRELVPLFQPIVNMKTNTLVGMEALLSWDSPTLGRVPPQEFVEEAERSGMMNEIGQWILRSACEQCLSWQKRTGNPLTLSVNVSAIQLNDNFINTLDDILEKTGFPATALTLELTESIFLLNIKQVIKRLKAISKRGVSVCIDDFGTGYSSLSYIHKLPIDALKIDRSFISDIDSSDVVIEATIAMASKLGLKVVAEGIESQHQREMMLRYPNLLAQGFYYSRPVNSEEFEKLTLFTKLLPKDGDNILSMPKSS
ncbi:MAG: putative bifunctional diguanylate cyclase/phosphodiesterase [Psychrobium sp.]